MFDLIKKWKRQEKMKVKTQVFRNITEANIFIKTLGDDFISSVNSRSGIIVTYYE